MDTYKDLRLICHGQRVEEHAETMKAQLAAIEVIKSNVDHLLSFHEFKDAIDLTEDNLKTLLGDLAKAYLA